MTHGTVGRTAVLATAVAVAIIIPGPAGAEEDAPADQLYVTNGALDQADPHPTVARFTADSTGRITRAGMPVETGVDARGIVFTPKDAYGRRFAYVSSLFAGVDGAINRYSVAANGALTPLPEDQEAVEPFGIAISPDGRTVYVANFDTTGDGQGAVTAYRVEPDGRLTSISTQPTGELHAKGVAITPDGRQLFVSNGAPPDGTGVLVGFPVNPDGTIGERVSRAEVGLTGHRVVITPNGRFVYVTSQNAGPGPDVFGFSIGTGGALTPVGEFDAGTWVEGAAISPDGNRLYATALDTVGPDGYPLRDGDIRGFAIGADGVLTEIAHLENTLFDPVDLAFGSDGKHLYVADFAVSKVTVFTVDSSGGIRPAQTVDSGGQNPGFQSVFVLNGR